MRRSALENLYHQKKTIEHNKAYKKQKNFCSRLYKKERKKYYANINLNDITDNKKFWQTVKPLFSNKEQNCKKITLVNNEDIVSEDVDIAETFFVFLCGC